MRYRIVSRRRSMRGFSIVELLVSVAIGLIVTLAVFGVLAASEGRKRTSVAVNDANQSGAYSAYTVDRLLRSAGSGYTQGWAKVNSCRINASFNSTQIWPRTTDLPAPFAGVPRTLRLAPIVIFAGASGAGSDVLMVMNGAAGFGEAPIDLQPGGVRVANPSDPTEPKVLLPNTIGYRRGDLVMLAAGGECLLSQVVATKTPCAGDPASPTATTPCGQDLSLGGAYYTASGANTSLTALAGAATVYAFALGNPGNATATPAIAPNLPQFQLLGVGDNSTLFAYDLLTPVNGAFDPVPVAEDVRELHAVYGVDTDSDGDLDGWQSPSATGWEGSTLMDGTAASSARLRQIVAVRVGFVMRSSLVERTAVSPDALALFSDLPSANRVSVDLTRTSENQNQRYRTVEVTIPLRNLLMRP